MAATRDDRTVTGNGSSSPKSSAKRQQQTAQEFVDSLALMAFSAIINGDLEGIREIYKFRRVVFIDKELNTTIHLSAKRGQLQILKWLLKNSFIPVSMKNERQEACTHLAAKFGNFKCLKTVMTWKGARPQALACDRDAQGMSILHYAAVAGRDDMVTWLAEEFGSDLCVVKNTSGHTALHFAAAKGHLKCVQILCKSGRKAVNTRDVHGATPLFYASQEGHLDCVQCLTAVCKADLKIATNDGHTPLHVAAKAGRMQVFQFLAGRLPKLDLSQRAKDGATVFHLAAANGHHDLLRFLLSCDRAHDAVRMRDIRGSSAAHDAADNGHLNCLKLLIDSGLDLQLRDEEGETPYSLAIRSDNTECATYVRSIASGEQEDLYSVLGAIKSTLASDNVPNIYGDAIAPKGVKKSAKRTTKIKYPKKSQDTQTQNGPMQSVSLNGNIANGTAGEFILRTEPTQASMDRQKRIANGSAGEFILRTEPTQASMDRQKRIFKTPNSTLFAKKTTPAGMAFMNQFQAQYAAEKLQASSRPEIHGQQGRIQSSEAEVIHPPTEHQKHNGVMANKMNTRAASDHSLLASATLDQRLTHSHKSEPDFHGFVHHQVSNMTQVTLEKRSRDKDKRSKTQSAPHQNLGSFQPVGQPVLRSQGTFVSTVSVPAPSTDSAPVPPITSRRPSIVISTTIPPANTTVSNVEENTSLCENLYSDVLWDQQDGAVGEPPPLPPRRRKSIQVMGQEEEELTSDGKQEDEPPRYHTTIFPLNHSNSNVSTSGTRICGATNDSEHKNMDMFSTRRDSATRESNSDCSIPDAPPLPPIQEPQDPLEYWKTLPKSKRPNLMVNHHRSKSSEDTLDQVDSETGTPTFAQIRDMLDRSGIIGKSHSKLRENAVKRGEFLQDNHIHNTDRPSSPSPREMNQKFTYLPNGNLAMDHHLRQTSRATEQTITDHSAKRQQVSSSVPPPPNSLPTSIVRKESAKLNEADEFKNLSQAHLRHVREPRTLPQPGSSDKYDYNPDQPSELELYFRKMKRPFPS